MKFTLVYRSYYSERVEENEDIMRLIMLFRPKYILSRPSDALNNINKSDLRKIIFKLSRVNCDHLKLVCASGMFVNGFENKRFLRFLDFKTSSKLTILSFRWCSISERLITSIYEFSKQRYEENRALEFVQLVRLYKSNVRGLNHQRIGYLLSKVAIFTKKYFHTQTDTSSNAYFYHLFLTAADFCSRKKVQSYVSLGADYNAVVNLSPDYRNIFTKLNVKLYSNPDRWVQDWSNNTSIVLEKRVVKGVLYNKI